MPYKVQLPPIQQHSEVTDIQPSSAPKTPAKPATAATAPDKSAPIERVCPGLPRGVRLIRFEPKPVPVAVDVCSIVVDVDLFIRRELEELNARLHSPVQIRGGWGVFTILDRLRQAGVELALEPTINKEPQTNSTSVPKTPELNFGASSSIGDAG